MTAKFWVGGTGTWDNSTTTNWSLASGGASGAAVPGTGDTVTFDASSGTGTCTVAATINGSNTISSLTCGAMTGPFILDFSVNNPSITMASLSATGTGTRTINFGTGTFTFTGGNTVVDFSTTTNLTLSAASSTFAFSGNQGNRNFLVGTSKTYGTLAVATSATTFAADLNISGTTPTFTAITVASPARLVLATSITVNNAFTFAGTNATNPIIVESATSQSATFTITCTSGTCSFDWCVIQGITGAGGATFNATNSFGWNNSNITVTGPSGGGGLQYRPNMSGNV